MQKYVRLQVPYYSSLLLLEIAKPEIGMLAPALGVDNTATPKMIKIVLVQVRQEKL